MASGERPGAKCVCVAVDVIDDEGAGMPREVFSDGTYDASGAGHFAAVDRAAQAFVGRTLGGEGEEGEEGRKWAGKAATAIEGAMYELGRALGVVEALRAREGRLLEMQRVGGKSSGSVHSGSTGSSGGLLIAKRRSLRRAAALLEERAGNLRLWVGEDNTFCETLRALRRRGGGMRRDRNGAPLIDVGDGEFARIRNIGAPHYLSVRGLKPTALRFGISAVADDCHPQTAPRIGQASFGDAPDVGSVQDDTRQASKVTAKAVNDMLCRLRASRLSAFRRLSFERFAGEVSATDFLISSTSNSVAVDCGPNHVVYLERTSNLGKGKDRKDCEAISSYVERDVQDASLVQIHLMESTLAQLRSGKESVTVHRNVLDVVEALVSIRTLESVLDHSADLLRVRIDWERGDNAVTERRARIWASSGDGCGSNRLIARIEPVSRANCGDYAHKSGNVRITPAFGVITSAPDDAWARTKSSIPAFQLFSSSPSAVSRVDGLDDVPCTYLCPLVGGEINSVICLLMCIRLLDSLESVARCSIPEILDIDRFGFTIVITPIRRNRVIRAKVWPRGGIAGQETASLTVWVDDKRVEDFPETSVGKIDEWRRIILSVLKEDATAALVESRNQNNENNGQTNVDGNQEGIELPYLNGTLQPMNLTNSTPMRQIIQNGPI